MPFLPSTVEIINEDITLNLLTRQFEKIV